MVVLDEWSSYRGGHLNRFDCIYVIFSLLLLSLRDTFFLLVYFFVNNRDLLNVIVIFGVFTFCIIFTLIWFWALIRNVFSGVT